MSVPQPRWAITLMAPHRMDSWIWPAMSGNGWTILLVWIQLSVQFVVYPCITARNICAAPVVGPRVSSTSPTIVTKMWVFVLFSVCSPSLRTSTLALCPSGTPVRRQKWLNPKIKNPQNFRVLILFLFFRLFLTKISISIPENAYLIRISFLAAPDLLRRGQARIFQLSFHKGRKVED